jgi:hypothetical protein
MLDLSRRSLLRGLFAAPAIVAADRIMPVKLWKPRIHALPDDWTLVVKDETWTGKGHYLPRLLTRAYNSRLELNEPLVSVLSRNFGLSGRYVTPQNVLEIANDIDRESAC